MDLIYYIYNIFANSISKMYLLNCHSPEKMLSQCGSFLVYKPVVNGKYNQRQKCVSCNELNDNPNMSVYRSENSKRSRRTACTFFNERKIPSAYIHDVHGE